MQATSYDLVGKLVLAGLGKANKSSDLFTDITKTGIRKMTSEMDLINILIR